METITINEATVNATHFKIISYLQEKETASFYCGALSEISEFITIADNPEVAPEKQMFWLKTLVMIKDDLRKLANAD